MKKIIAFDCDSTLSAIEGVDELARLAGEDIFQEVEALTNQAMNGEIPVEEVFARRLDLIKPSQSQCEKIADLYEEHIEPSAKETILKLQAEGWQCLIISGGFAPCIANFASFLNIEKVEAVPISFHPDGSYAGFDDQYPTTRDGGKPEIIQLLKKEYDPDIIVMVGDGNSDLETQSDVDAFYGFTGFVKRKRVIEDSLICLDSLADLPSQLSGLSAKKK